ncbi:MAG: hypothetical protein AAF902_07580 [Chloroflexota bacterium]
MAAKNNLDHSLCIRIITASFYLSLLAALSGCSLVDPILPVGNPPSEPLIPTSTPRPTATADPTGRFIAYLNTDYGVALRYPPNWIVNADNGLRVTSSADFLTGSHQGDEGALMEIVLADETLYIEDDLATPLEDYVIDLGNQKVVESPNNILIGGQSAAVLLSQSNDEDGRELTHLFALIKNENAGVLVSSTTADPETNESLLRGIISTIIVSRPEPTPAPPTLTPAPPGSVQIVPVEGEDGEALESGSMSVPAGLLQFSAPDGHFSLGYPSNWLIRDDGTAIILASTQELMIDNKFESGASILIFPQTLSTPDEPDPVKILEDFVGQFAVYDNLPELIVPPRPLTLGGQSAATAQYDAIFQRYPVLIDYYVIVRGSRVVIMVNLIASPDFQSIKPVTDGIAASITVNP